MGIDLDLREYLDFSEENGRAICREERQYALFLYNRLMEQGKIVIKEKNEKVGENYEIIQACYEVSFMRDFFHALEEGKKEFNERLINFAYEKMEAGSKGIQHSDDLVGNKDFSQHMNILARNKNNNIPAIAQFMMNAKPDISLLLKKKDTEEEELFLYFIECKYISGIDQYIKGNIKRSQLDIQQYIIDFLCNSQDKELELTYDGKTVKAGKVIQCYFQGRWKNSRRGYSGGVSISQLLDQTKKFELEIIYSGKEIFLKPRE